MSWWQADATVRRRREGPETHRVRQLLGRGRHRGAAVVSVRPVCLPVLARLWRPRHTGKIAHARELAELIAARYPDGIVHVVGDAAYVGERLRDVDDRISWTSRLKVTSVLHELPPPAPDAPGDRAPAVPGWAPRPMSRPRDQQEPGAAPRSVVTAHDTVQMTERFCLWYGSFRSRTVRVILVCDDNPDWGGDDRGYGLPLVTTDLQSSAEELVAATGHGGESNRPSPTPAKSSESARPATDTSRRGTTVPFGLICSASSPSGTRARPLRR